MHVKQAIRKGS